MHMADALLSPAVGGAMWAVSGCAVAYAVRAARREEEWESNSSAPLMAHLTNAWNASGSQPI